MASKTNAFATNCWTSASSSLRCMSRFYQEVSIIDKRYTSIIFLRYIVETYRYNDKNMKPSNIYEADETKLSQELERLSSFDLPNQVSINAIGLEPARQARRVP